MSIIKWNQESETVPFIFPNISNLMESFIGKNLWNEGFATPGTPSVNITDCKNNFKIDVAVPGMSKQDFSLKCENNVLTIKGQREDKKEDKEGSRYTRREFNYSAFQRSFTLPEIVDTEKIFAEYKEGILSITLPKKEEEKEKPAKEIKIA